MIAKPYRFHLLRFFQSLHEPHNGKAGNEIKTRHYFFHKVEQSPKSALPAAKGPVENERRNGRPNDVAKFAKYGNGVGCVADDIHQHTKYQRGRCLLFVHFLNLRKLR